MSADDLQNKISSIVLYIFNRYVPDASQETIQKISDNCGLRLDQLTPENADVFLEAMRAELTHAMEEWKAKFVTGVIRQLINRGDFDKKPPF
jgi:hypothetical protein